MFWSRRQYKFSRLCTGWFIRTRKLRGIGTCRSIYTCIAMKDNVYNTIFTTKILFYKQQFNSEPSPSSVILKYREGNYTIISIFTCINSIISPFFPKIWTPSVQFTPEPPPVYAKGLNQWIKLAVNIKFTLR